MTTDALRCLAALVRSATLLAILARGGALGTVPARAEAAETQNANSAAPAAAANAPKADKPAPSVVGDWIGSLDADGQTIRLAIHITKRDGTLAATLDSLDQGAMGIPVSKVGYADGVLTLELAAVQAR